MHKDGRKLKRLCVLLTVFFLLLGYSAAAAGTAGLRVEVRSESDEPIGYMNVELLQVAAVTGGVAVLRPDFAALGIPAEELLADSGAGNAELVYQYVTAEELEGTVKYTAADGAVDFAGLEAGIYLVMERGGQKAAFRPYLVILRDGEQLISIPKTSDTDTHTLLVVKLWEDDMNSAGKRPDSIQVTVLRDGVPFRRVTLSEANRWQHSFYMLPGAGTYTVEESVVPNYTAEYTPVAEGYVIVNKYSGGTGDSPNTPMPQKAHVVVRKVWNDNNNAAGKRPDSVTVQLVRGSTVIKTAVLSDSNSWIHTFTGLDASGNYTVREIPVTDYAADYQGNAAEGIVITNTYTGTTDPGTPPEPEIPEPKQIDIPVKVVWVDDNNAAGKRPAEVTVRLIADGGIVSSLQLGASGERLPEQQPNADEGSSLEQKPDVGGETVSTQRLSTSSRGIIKRMGAANSWDGVFSNVDGDLSYSVWQNAVAEYTTTYSGDMFAGFVITNTYTSGTTDPGVPPDPTPPGPPDDPEDPVEPPVNPDDPQQPLADPDDPATPPDEPEKPDGPTIPQTGTEMGAIYLLFALGALLMLLGIVDLARGRRES